MRFPEAQIVARIKGMTDEQFSEVRRGGYGGSDTGTILNMSQYGGPFTVWMSKVHGTSTPANEAMMMGHKLEDFVRRDFAEEHGYVVHKADVILKHPIYDFIRASPDGIIVVPGDPGIHEIKTTTQDDDWGQESQDATEPGVIPDRHLVQVHQYMLVTDFKWMIITVLLGGRGGFKMRSWKILRDPEWDEIIISTLTDFHDKVTRRIAPAMDGSKATTRLLTQIYGEPNPSPTVFTDNMDSLVGQYVALKTAGKVMDDSVNILGNEIRWKMGDAARGETERFVIHYGHRSNGSRPMMAKMKKEFVGDE